MPSLISLLTIVEHGSINRAAEILNISQPALTRNIAKLEQTLNASLLERSAKGVVLTPFGQAVIRHVQNIQAELRNLINDVEALKGNAAGQIRLGATPMILSHFLPPALEYLHRTAPLVGIRVSDGTRPSLLGQLRLGDLDMVVATASFERDGEESEVAQEHLFDMDLTVVVKPDHPLTRQNTLKLSELAVYQWILPRADSSLYRRIEQEFKKAGVAFSHAAIEIPSPDAAKALVRATELLAILPSRTVEKELADGALTALHGDWAFEQRSVAAFYRHGVRSVPAIKKLAEYLRHERISA